MGTAARARVQASPRPTRGLPAHPGGADGAKQPSTGQTPSYGDETSPGPGLPPHGFSPGPDLGSRVILEPRRYTPGRAPRAAPRGALPGAEGLGAMLLGIIEGDRLRQMPTGRGQLSEPEPGDSQHLVCP